MATLADIRQAYPQYNDLSDRELAGKLHEKFYADIPRAEFDQRVGVAPETWGEYAAGLARQGIGQGTLAGFGDEAEAALRAAVTPGDFGQIYNENVGRIRRENEQFAREHPGATVAANLVGGAAPFVAGPGAGLARLAIGSTLPRTIARSALLGSGIGAVSGAGSAEGDISDRAAGAAHGAVLGAGLGAAIPPVASALGAAARSVGNVISPAVARVQGAMEGRLRPPPIEGATPISTRQQPITGATFIDDAGNAAEVGPGAVAQARQILANEATRAGHTNLDSVRQELARFNRARTFNEGSEAPSAVSLAEVFPGGRRVLGAATRASTESGETADRFFAARQTGHTPPDGKGLHEGAGIPTRDPMSPPITGAQAEKRYGTSYGTPAKRLVSMGQRERESDALRRSMLIRDEEEHGHLPSAYQTRRALEAEGKAESDRLYNAFRKAAEGYDIRPAIQGKMDEIRATIDNPATPADTAEWLQKVWDSFNRKIGKQTHLVQNMEGFDAAKKAVDAKIESHLTDNYGKKVMRDTLNDLLNSIPDNDVGKAYRAARNAHFTNKQAQEAYELGRQAAREGSEVGAEHYRELPGEETGKAATLKKLFRLGTWEHYNERMKALKPTDDITNIFKQRDLDMLSDVIPRTKTEVRGTPRGEYGDRPERFAQYTNMERRMLATQRATRGGSQTAERLRDDEAFDVANQVVSSVRSLGDLGVRLVSRVLNRMFGYQADTSQAITTHLLTVDPAKQEQLLRGIEARMGKNRFDLFIRLLNENQGRLGVLLGQASGRAANPPQSQQPTFL